MKRKIRATAGSVLDLLANSFSELDYLEMFALNSSINLFSLYIWFYQYNLACAHNEILR